MESRTNTHRAERVARVLLATAVLAAALILLAIARFLVTAANAERRAADTPYAIPTKPQAAQEWLAPSKSIAAQLKKGNLFTPEPAKQHPVSEVLGILGSEALINGRWYKAGDRVGDAEVLLIEPTKVRIAWDGQEKEFSPIGATGSGGPDSSGPGRARGGRGPTPPGAPMVVAGGRPGSASGRPGGPPGLSAEERERVRERLATMSPEERERALAEMRERSGRRRR